MKQASPEALAVSFSMLMSFFSPGGFLRFFAIACQASPNPYPLITITTRPLLCLSVKLPRTVVQVQSHYWVQTLVIISLSTHNCQGLKYSTVYYLNVCTLLNRVKVRWPLMASSVDNKLCLLHNERWLVCVQIPYECVRIQLVYVPKNVTRVLGYGTVQQVQNSRWAAGRAWALQFPGWSPGK
jgi:hypothetical protein